MLSDTLPLSECKENGEAPMVGADGKPHAQASPREIETFANANGADSGGVCR